MNPNTDALRLQGLSQFADRFTTSAMSGQVSNEKIDRLIRKVQIVAESGIKETLQGAKDGDGIFAGRDTSCRAGCAYCCKQSVAATLPEILSLAQWLRQTKSPEEFAAIKTRVDAYRQGQEKRSLLDRTSARNPCPLLFEETCAAYEARPLVCRSYHSYDLPACIDYYEGKTEGIFPGVQMNHLTLKVVDAIRNGILSSLEKAGIKYRLLDVGVALSIALEYEDALARVLAGEDLFSRASNQGPPTEQSV